MSDQDSNPKQTGHTPTKLTQSFLDPYCAVDQEGKPVLEMLHSFEPGIAGEYLRSIIEAFNSHAALAEENALRTNKIAEILRLEVDGEEFYIPAESGPLGPFESLEEAAKEFMEFMDRTDKKMREENAQLRKALSADLWLVWSHEHGVWWKPNKCGYTPAIEHAGRYSLDEALKCCEGRSARKDGLPNEIAVPSPELIALQRAALKQK